MSVSRETEDKLKQFLALLQKWNSKINLVSRQSIEDAWTRHIMDSLQVVDLLGSGVCSYADFGSGGGFPGVVVAIAMNEKKAEFQANLVESDQRKSAFLRGVSRETKVPMTILSERIEVIKPLNVDVVTARALAPLSKLLEYTDRHMSQTGKAIFLKGENWEKELRDAQNQWNFTWEARKSLTNPDAVILEIGDLSRA